MFEIQSFYIHTVKDNNTAKDTFTTMQNRYKYIHTTNHSKDADTYAKV